MLDASEISYVKTFLDEKVDEFNNIATTFGFLLNVLEIFIKTMAEWKKYLQALQLLIPCSLP